MDLREEVYLHEDDMHDDHLPPQATASPAVQHSLLDMCDGGYPLPIQVLDKRTANRIYKTLTQLHPEFPSPTPALYLHNLIATQRDEIIALWQSSTQNLLPNHGYRKTIEAQIAHNAIYKVDKAMYAFLLTTVLLGKGALLTTDQQKIAMQPTQNKHAYLLEQLALVPRPTRAEELMQYRRQVEQLGILSPIFCTTLRERNTMTHTRTLYAYGTNVAYASNCIGKTSYVVRSSPKRISRQDISPSRISYTRAYRSLEYTSCWAVLL
jgi:hypothetical protein